MRDDLIAHARAQHRAHAGTDLGAYWQGYEAGVDALHAALTAQGETAPAPEDNGSGFCVRCCLPMGSHRLQCPRDCQPAASPLPAAEHQHKVYAYDESVCCKACKVTLHGAEASALWARTPSYLRVLIDGPEPTPPALPAAEGLEQLARDLAVELNALPDCSRDIVPNSLNCENCGSAVPVILAALLAVAEGQTRRTEGK